MHNAGVVDHGLVMNEPITDKFQLMLVTSNLRDGILSFQLHKEGLLLLRKFRNKRLRIIFNVSHRPEDLQKFNACFLSQAPCDSSMSHNNNWSELRISEHFQELSENRVIVFLNAYQNPETTNLLVIGYLVASVFLYHNHQPLSDDSHLTRMLSRLKKQLEGTRVDVLQQEIKYKSGCCKKPYLMCLFDQPLNKDDNWHELFREFYKYRENPSPLNQSVDTLIDYFPERSAIAIPDDELRQGRIRKLGDEYRANILGRQIFNFEITGWTLENLCFELCQVFNSNASSINLVKIYTKIINNQKMQVLNQTAEKFNKLSAELMEKLPYDPTELQQAYSRVEKYIVEQSIADACNCMIFSEYQSTYRSIINIMEKKCKAIVDRNKELLRDRAISCYQRIEEDDELDQQLESMNCRNAPDLLELISEKIMMFVEETVHDFNTRDMLTRLISKYVDLFSDNLKTCLESASQNERNLLDRISRVESDNRVYQLKCKELENEYMYLNSINNQFKQKLLNNRSHQHDTTEELPEQAVASAVLDNLHHQIQKLELELNEKNQTIEHLTEILDKFEIEFNRKSYKPKFNKDVQNLLSEITHKINDIYSLFNDLKKTQKFYQDIEHEFEIKKSELDKKRQSEKLELEEVRQKMNQVVKQKACIEKIAEEGRNTISTMQNVEAQYKNIVNELENSCSRLKCLLAETEGEFEKYKKALELTVNCCVTGRADKLKDFYKVAAEEELRQMIKPIFKK